MRIHLILSAVLVVFFAACQNPTKEKANNDSPITVSDSTKIKQLAKGKSRAMQVKRVLGGNLMKALKELGSAGAVEFCNTRAIPITDSMSSVLLATIHRISDKSRNLMNTADEAEIELITQWKQDLYGGKELKPLFQKKKGKEYGYYPIVTNTMCLQCHGEPELDINPETLEKLNALYPEDQATGYKENQVRGAFVVELE